MRKETEKTEEDCKDAQKAAGIADFSDGAPVCHHTSDPGACADPQVVDTGVNGSGNGGRLAGSHMDGLPLKGNIEGGHYDPPEGTEHKDQGSVAGGRGQQKEGSRHAQSDGPDKVQGLFLKKLCIEEASQKS